MIERLGFDLFGRHVRHRADDHPGPCEPEGGDVVAGTEKVCVNRPRQPEVEDLHTAVVSHHHVRGFQIAVNDVFPMRRRKRVGQGNRDVEEPRQREPVPRYPLVERAPLDELHSHERNTTVFLDGEDGHDVRVVERGDGASFPAEARQPIGVGRHLLRQDLEGHVAAELGVGGAIHFAHSARAQRSLDLVRTQTLA